MTRNSLSIFNQLRPFTVGYDTIFDRFENMFDNEHFFDQGGNYPPYNIVKTGDYTYDIELALAGFSQDDLSIETKSGELTVSGSGEKNSQAEFIHKGIAKRAFKQIFRLADYIEVDGAEFKDGLLSIFLHREKPEKEIPRKIVINKNS